MMHSSEMAERIRSRIAMVEELAPDTVGSAFDIQLVDCDTQAGVYSFLCKTAAWMKNPIGSLHGGISATVADQAMGIVAISIRQEQGMGPTVQLQLTYHRPLMAGEDILLKVRVLSVAKSMTHLSAEAYCAASSDAICFSASGIYYFKPAI